MAFLFPSLFCFCKAPSIHRSFYTQTLVTFYKSGRQTDRPLDRPHTVQLNRINVQTNDRMRAKKFKNRMWRHFQWFAALEYINPPQLPPFAAPLHFPWYNMNSRRVYGKSHCKLSRDCDSSCWKLRFVERSRAVPLTAGITGRGI